MGRPARGSDRGSAVARPQRARVEDAYTDLLEDLQGLDRAHLQPIPALPLDSFPNYQLRSYELDLPPDQPAALREQFQAALRAALAETQAELLLQAIDQQLSPWLLELSHARLRLTWAQQPEPNSEGDNYLIAVESVESNPPPANQKLQHVTRYLYPLDDDTALACRHYATLLRRAAVAPAR